MEVIVGILIAVLVVLSVVLSYMACFAVLPKVHTLDYKLEYLKKLILCRERVWSLKKNIR